MTNEEAIAIIENEKKCVNRANKNDYCNRDCYNCELVKTDTEILTALDLAIKALEQQPCDDVISRKAVIRTLNKMDRYTATELTLCDTDKNFPANEVFIVDDVYEQITEHLPSVMQKSTECDDAISRQAVLDGIAEWIVDGYADSEADCSHISSLVTHLPPVTPQQKYGKWIKHPEIETSTPEYLMFYECSECGDKQCFCKSDLHKKRFCNSCGAKMQESEDKE